MKKSKTLVSLGLAGCMLLAGAASVCAAPADVAPAAVDTGKVTVCVETATVNGEYIQKPVQLDYVAGKTVQYYLDQIKDASGESVVNVVSSSWGPYINYVKNPNTAGLNYQFTAEANAADALHGRTTAAQSSFTGTVATAGQLAAYDYNINSGWNIVYNNTSPYTGIAQNVSEGDCITLAFTVYGGMDIGFPGWPQNADGTWNTNSDDPFAGTYSVDPEGNKVKIDKTELIEKVAYVNAHYTDLTPEQSDALDAADAAVLNVKADDAVVSSAITGLNQVFTF